MGMIYAPPSIIPNGALINNVCHIYQTTKPTARPDGSALMVGDKWYNTDTGVEGFWNGTYWLGGDTLGSATNAYSKGSTIDNGAIWVSGNIIPMSPVFIESVNIQMQGNPFTGLLNNSNNFGLAVLCQDVTSPAFVTIDSNTLLNNLRIKPENYLVNMYCNILGGGGGFTYIIFINKVGSPTLTSAASNIQVQVNYKRVLL